MLKISGALLVLTLGTIAVANANPIPAVPTPISIPPMRAPEISPDGAFAALTLLAGGLAVLRGRRARK